MDVLVSKELGCEMLQIKFFAKKQENKQ